MRHRKHNYVVGFGGENQCAYGKDTDGVYDYVDLLTKAEAEEKTKTLEPSKPSNRYVFKLVPVLRVD